MAMDLTSSAYACTNMFLIATVFDVDGSLSSVVCEKSCYHWPTATTRSGVTAHTISPTSAFAAPVGEQYNPFCTGYYSYLNLASSIPKACGV
jgi:hypothetical protein